MKKVDVEGTEGKRSGRQLLTMLLILVVAIPILLLSLKENDLGLRSESPVRVGHPAPDFTFPDLTGKKVSLTDFRGKVVFVNVWATWCPPCREEMPSMQKLYERFKNEEFKILAVSIDSNGREAVAPFMEKLNLTFPALLDPESKMWGLYGLTGVPESFIMDREGLVVKKIVGAIDWAAQDVFRFFQELIKNPGS